ncbi:MAG: SurA N-terminal domain-containing protein [Pseudomonadota bacterium]
MIESLRAFAGSWVAKILLVLLVASFAVVGIQIAGSAVTSVAEVGDEDIDARDFQRAFASELNALNRRLQPSGRALTPDEAAAAGLHFSTINRMMVRSALGQEAFRMGLDAPDEQVRRFIEEDPIFSNGGRFDAAVYEDYVTRSLGMRRAQYEEDQRRVLAIALLTTPAAVAVTAPSAAAETIWRRENETRSVGALVLEPAQIAEAADPGDDVLRAHHSTFDARFTENERRKIELLKVSAEELVDVDAITDAEIRAAYDASGALYNQPERRNIERLDFQDADAAAAGVAQARDGATLPEVAGALGRSAEEVRAVSLGYVTEAQFGAFTPELAEAAFAAEDGAVLDPIETGGRFAVLRVAGVEAGRDVPLDAVRDVIARELALRDARRRTPEIATSVEDALAGGASFDEIADQRGVRFLELDIDRAGRLPDGRPSADLPADERFLEEAFSQEIGEERDLAQTEGRDFWTAVTTEITPATLRPFEEARADVLADWRRVARAEALEERARSAAARIEAGEAAEAIAADLGVEMRRLDALRRGGDGATPAGAVDAVFALGADEAVGRAVIANDGPRRWVLAVLDVSRPDPSADDPGLTSLSEALSAGVAQDLQTLFQSAIWASYASEIDEAAVQQVLFQQHGGGGGY